MKRRAAAVSFHLQKLRGTAPQVVSVCSGLVGGEDGLAGGGNIPSDHLEVLPKPS